MSEHILGPATVMTFLCAGDRERAKTFYGGTLGLTQVSEDSYAVVFETDGRMLRISSTKDFKPQPFTVLGWSVRNIAAVVRTLKEKGVRFQIYDGLDQDEFGIWTVQGSRTKVAWFTDPDGNVLSLTQF